MKKFLAMLIIISSCTPDPPPPNDPGNILVGHYWICDSVKTTTAGIGHTDIVGQGMGLDIEFSANGTYQVYSNPPTIKNYLVRNDTLYYWSPPGLMNLNQYEIIKSLSNKKLHTWQRDNATNKEFDYYNHYN